MTNPTPPPELFHSLRDLLGDRFSTAQSVRDQHARDESYHPAHPPQAVAFPRSTEEVAAVVRACSAHGVPVVPFGAGTSVEGHVIPIRGGVSLDLREMDRVLRVRPDDLDVTVQAGVTRKALEAELKGTGLFFPVDPGADATLGGMAATAASGTTTVRYGTMADNVLALEVVLADGRVIRTGSRARKSAAGYDLTHLFVGSEGTLGVITQITLRLHGIPEAISAVVCPFPTVDAAVTTVIRTIQFGLPLARAELLDTVSIQAVNAYAELDYPEQPTVFFEFHGTGSEVEEQASLVRTIAGEYGGEEFRWATKRADRDRLWQARHDAYPALLALRPGCEGLTTDVCVPISRLAECIAETMEDIRDAGVPVGLVGHVGDGNFHLAFMIDPERPEELERVSHFNGRLVRRALAMEGTCTGEHGVGLGKMGFLREEHGDGVDVMRSIKAALDPRGMLNPGKVVELG